MKWKDVCDVCVCVFFGEGGSDNDGCDEIDGDHSSQRNRQSGKTQEVNGWG